MNGSTPYKKALTFHVATLEQLTRTAFADPQLGDDTRLVVMEILSRLTAASEVALRQLDEQLQP